MHGLRHHLLLLVQPFSAPLFSLYIYYSKWAILGQPFGQPTKNPVLAGLKVLFLDYRLSPG